MMPLVWWHESVSPPRIDHAVSAMAYARNNGVKIIACSFNGKNLISLKDEIEQGEPQGVLYIFSAGNSPDQTAAGADVDTDTTSLTTSPCNNLHPNLICVTAVNKHGNKPIWANWGVKGVHVGAPGDDIFSTLHKDNEPYGKPAHATVPFPPGSGTSYAAPHVTGVVALMRHLNPGYSMKQIREYLLLAANNSRFFSNTTTGARWAVAHNATGVTCNNFVREVSGTVDRVAEVTYSGVAGTGGSSWTLAGFKANYPPGAAVQTIAFRVTTPDGSAFTGKSGRIGGGIVGQTGLSQQTCAATGQGFTRMTFGGSMIAGIELHTGKPFIYFDPPYVEYTYSAISLTGRNKLSISLAEGTSAVRFRITDSKNGQQLFSQDIPYPGGWNWTGTDKPAIVYYGTSSGSGNLYVRSLVSVRP